MSEPGPSLVVTLATLGLAVGGPVALLSGLITFVTIPSGIAPALLIIFLFATALTTLSALVFLAQRAKNDG